MSTTLTLVMEDAGKKKQFRLLLLKQLLRVSTDR